MTPTLLKTQKEWLIELIKAMPDEFPDIESDMFDDGYKQCKEDLLAIVNHVCCDGECHHDDCCGKVKENCPLTKNI